MIAAYMLEVHDDDVEFDVDRFVVKSAGAFQNYEGEAFAAYNQAIPGIEPGLEAVSYYDPPNMTILLEHISVSWKLMLTQVNTKFVSLCFR